VIEVYSEKDSCHSLVPRGHFGESREIVVTLLVEKIMEAYEYFENMGSSVLVFFYLCFTKCRVPITWLSLSNL